MSEQFFRFGCIQEAGSTYMEDVDPLEDPRVFVAVVKHVETLACVVQEDMKFD